MTTQTLTLTDFLLARIAEDEAIARLVPAGGGSWEAGDRCVWRTGPLSQLDIVTDGHQGDGGCETSAVADHIALHDPTRVLAECEAKRSIVARRTDEDLGYSAPNPMIVECLDACLADMAAVYAEHPDYLEEWKP